MQTDKRRQEEHEGGPEDSDEIRVSKTHVIAHLKQDNGEVQEDVVHQKVVQKIEADRVTGSHPVAETVGRDHPDEPLPGTLPPEDHRTG
jgi:hypothetical protein